MMGCFGGESSIFMCRNPGWKKGIPSSCSRPKRDAGVFCYNNGMKLLDNGKTSSIYLTILKKNMILPLNINFNRFVLFFCCSQLF